MSYNAGDRPNMSSGTGGLVHLIFIVIGSIIWGSIFWEDALYSDSALGSAIVLGVPLIVGMISWAVFQTKHNKADELDAYMEEANRKKENLSKFHKLEEEAEESPGRVMSELMDFIIAKRRDYIKGEIEDYEFVLLGKLMILNSYATEYYRFLDSFRISTRIYEDDELVDQCSEQKYSLTSNEITKIRMHVKDLVDEAYEADRTRVQEEIMNFDSALQDFHDDEKGKIPRDRRVMEDDPYAASVKGRTYHERECPVLSKVSPETMITFQSMTEAEGDGYVLCSYCRKRKRMGFKS